MPTSSRCAPEWTSSVISSAVVGEIGIAGRHERHERRSFFAAELENSVSMRFMGSVR